MRLNSVLSLLTIHTRPVCAAACASLFFFTSLVDAAVRPVPAVVNVKTFARADRDHLDLLIRLPLAGVKNVQFPLRDSVGHIDIKALQTMQAGMAKNWVAETLEVFDRGAKLAPPDVMATRVSISSDLSFGAYRSALEHFAAPDLDKNEEVLWQQVWFDVHLRYGITANSKLSIEPHVASLGVKVTTEFVVVENGETERSLTFEGNPGRLYLNPSGFKTFTQFFSIGLKAVLRNADVVFLFCLALPFRRWRDALPATVAFASALVIGFLSMRLGIVGRGIWAQTLIGALVAGSIVTIAAANIIDRVTPRRRALFALVAGIIFGMSGAIRYEGVGQFAADNQIAGGGAYAIGMMLAAACAVAIFVPLMKALFSYARAETLERIIVSALAADTAWSWFVDRGAQFANIPFNFDFDESPGAVIGIVGLAALVGAALWFVNRWLKQHGFADELVRINAPR